MDESTLLKVISTIAQSVMAIVVTVVAPWVRQIGADITELKRDMVGLKAWRHDWDKQKRRLIKKVVRHDREIRALKKDRGGNSHEE